MVKQTYRSLVDNKWNKHYLKDVWYTPDVVKNLFSVPAAADKGLEYWLNKSSCKYYKERQNYCCWQQAWWFVQIYNEDDST